jgi:hypothetical protein
VLLQLDIDWLVILNVHQMQRSSTLSNHIQISGILRVVETVQLPVINAEAIGPKVEHPLLRLSLGAAGGRNRLAGRVGNGAALNAVAADGLAGSAEEARGWRAWWGRRGWF